MFKILRIYYLQASLFLIEVILFFYVVSKIITNSISINLLDSYFLLENVTCFCETCHKLRGEEPYFKKGDPPKEFAQPFGWCRFPLRYVDQFICTIHICTTHINELKNSYCKEICHIISTIK